MKNITLHILEQTLLPVTVDTLSRTSRLNCELLSAANKLDNSSNNPTVSLSGGVHENIRICHSYY